MSVDPPPPPSTSDLDLPIAIRKGKHTCTDHPISNFVSFDHLSPSFKAISLSVSSLVVPKSYRESFSHPVVYVDDIVITGSDKEGIQILINHLSSSFPNKNLATLKKPNLKLMPNEVSIVSQFMTNPRVPHMDAIIRILKYLKNAPGGNLITWRSKKQSVVAHSSIEAEYRAMAHTTCELTWLRTILQEFGLLVESNGIVTPFVPSGSQLANIFTKALPKNAIDSICNKLGVIDIYSPA
uniref:Reverse transcriptase Ty1/copia-type domain-containing protein n=1 Tax=Fagus sylvatica TaxID=28930 RepID=A0A2N9G2N4_FAGSY